MIDAQSKAPTWLYRGFTLPDGERCIEKADGGTVNWRLDLVNHSPTGLSWGYGGSGPAQCALALCADYLADDELALEIYQTFKSEFVCRWADDWTLTRHQMKNLVDWCLQHVGGRRL